MEVNHRKIQVASLFTSIQQVETEICKEKETTEQHNRNKALSNLKKARFMKQMQNLTKELKQQTILTHSYPIPKPTNATELIKKLPDNTTDEVPIPDITNDLQKELTKLGLNITPLTNTNSSINKGSSKNTPKCKPLASPSSTSNQEESTIDSTKKPTCEDKVIKQSKPTNKCEEMKQLKAQQLQKSEVQQLSSPVDKKENTEKLIEASAKQPTMEISNDSPSEDSFSQDSNSLKLSHNDHIEAYPWAHQASENFSKTTPLAEKEEVEFPNISYTSFRKYLTAEQRENMIELIALPQVSLKKIEQNIGKKKEDKKTTYFCKVCDPKRQYQCPRKTICRRHVRTHLRYSLYRCSFCNFISNNPTNIYSHYLLKHGIPKKWTLSQKV